MTPRTGWSLAIFVSSRSDHSRPRATPSSQSYRPIFLGHSSSSELVTNPAEEWNKQTSKKSGDGKELMIAQSRIAFKERARGKRFRLRLADDSVWLADDSVWQTLLRTASPSLQYSGAAAVALQTVLQDAIRTQNRTEHISKYDLTAWILNLSGVNQVDRRAYSKKLNNTKDFPRGLNRWQNNWC